MFSSLGPMQAGNSAKGPSPLNSPPRFAIRAANCLPLKCALGAMARGAGALAARWPELQINQRDTDVFYVRHHTRSTRDLPVSSTFHTIANIIAETCDIPRDSIKPESHAINDLGIDSLDFLDIAFAIDKAFGIKLPLEQWTQEVNDGKATTDQYFVLKNLSARIDELVAAKGA